MSYCVKCGVELDEGAERCPLCGTPAWKPDETAPRYFPTKPAEVPRASRRAAAALLTAMLASVSLCCGLLNLILPTEHPWALYVAGAAVMLWIWFALPMLMRGIPIFFRLTADVAAVGVYVFHRHLRLDHLRCAARGALVPRARAADARMGVRCCIPAELSAARRQKVASFLPRHVHRRGGPDGDGCRILP